MSSKRSSQKSFGRRKSKKSRKTSKCKQYLQEKIRINMNEFKQGRFKSRAQAIAVSYSQVKKKHPRCRRFLEK